MHQKCVRAKVPLGGDWLQPSKNDFKHNALICKMFGLHYCGIWECGANSPVWKDKTAHYKF